MSFVVTKAAPEIINICNGLINSQVSTNYLPLTGGTLSGSLTVPSLTVNGSSYATLASEVSSNTIDLSSLAGQTENYYQNIVAVNLNGLPDITSTCTGATTIAPAGSGTIMILNCHIQLAMTVSYTGTTTSNLAIGYGNGSAAASNVTNINTSVTAGYIDSNHNNAIYYVPVGFLTSNFNYNLPIVVGWNGTAPTGGTGTATFSLTYTDL